MARRYIRRTGDGANVNARLNTNQSLVAFRYRAAAHAECVCRRRAACRHAEKAERGLRKAFDGVAFDGIEVVDACRRCTVQ